MTESTTSSQLQLLPHQQADLEAWLALKSPRALINANEMTLGKSVDAVVCGKACDYKRILIVAIASTRPEWQDHFTNWWPERERPASIDKGFFRKNMSGPERVRLQAKLENPTHICSPQLLPQLANLHATGELAGYDYIVVDEFHQLAKFSGKAFQALWELRQRYPNADIKPMSGTPVNVEPLKAWSWLKICEPARWGTLRKGEDIPFLFKKTWGKATPSEYAFSGWSYSGVNEERLPKFKAAVSHLIRRTTIAEAKLSLPPMRFEMKKYPQGMTAAEATADWAERAIESQPVAIFTHNVEPMNEIEAELNARGIPVVRLYQEHKPEQRAALVKAALVSGHCVILATSGLVSTGVNFLANVKMWMLAQPSKNPTEVQQLARRFARLSSTDKEPRIGFLLYQEGEEFAPQKALSKRLKTVKAVVSATSDQEALSNALDNKSNQAFLDRLMLLGRQAVAYAGVDDSDDDSTNNEEF